MYRLRFTYSFTDYRESVYHVPHPLLGAGNSALKQTVLAGGEVGGFDVWAQALKTESQRTLGTILSSGGISMDLSHSPVTSTSLIFTSLDHRLWKIS